MALLQHTATGTATHCNTLQYIAINATQIPIEYEKNAARLYTLKHGNKHCNSCTVLNTAKDTATYTYTLQHSLVILIEFEEKTARLCILSIWLFCGIIPAF